jgi:hypothetical protein
VLVVLIGGSQLSWADDGKASFKYRWIGTDQWAAGHGCNVNIPKEYQKKGERYYQIWGSFHTLSRLLPSETYFETHPEYFALRDHLRTPEQLCLSHPDVQRIVAENLIGIIRDNPDVDGVTLGPQDNRLFCQCDQCRALDEKDPAPDQVYSRRLFLFYRAVADRVHRVYPDILVRFGCYDIYAAPPKDPSLTLPPHTFPLICHYQKYCNNRPVTDPLCPENARFREIIDAWRRLAGKLFIYEYYYKVNWLGMPWPLVSSMRRDIPWYRDHGVVGLYSQYHPDAAGSLLNYHVAAALMLDKDADVDKLVEGFCRATFGPGWEEMREYFQALEKAMQGCGVCIPGRGFAFPHAPKVFTDKVLTECNGLLNAAKSKVVGTPYEENVRKFCSLTDYTKRCVAFLRLAVEGLGGGRLGVEILSQSAEGIAQSAEGPSEIEKNRAFHGVNINRAQGSGIRAEKAAEALHAGEGLVEYLGQNRKKFEGVIPSPESVNPYMQMILDELAKPSTDFAD